MIISAIRTCLSTENITKQGEEEEKASSVIKSGENETTITIHFRHKQRCDEIIMTKRIKTCGEQTVNIITSENGTVVGTSLKHLAHFLHLTEIQLQDPSALITLKTLREIQCPSGSMERYQFFMQSTGLEDEELHINKLQEKLDQVTATVERARRTGHDTSVMKDLIDSMRARVESRRLRYKFVHRRVVTLFHSSLFVFSGNISVPKFNFTEKTLDLEQQIDETPSPGRSQWRTRPMMSLSGDERSALMIGFLFALWSVGYHNGNPIRALDCSDLFDRIVTISRLQDQQLILVSHHDTSQIMEPTEHMTVFRMSPN